MVSVLSLVAPSVAWVGAEGVPHDGWADIEALLGSAGLELDGWQRDVLEGSLRVAGGRWVGREVGCVVARQNGKGAILEARQLAGLFVLGERLQVHSAHEFKTCFEHFRRVRDLIESTPELDRQVKIIRAGAGDQAVELRNGCRLRFIARSRQSGKGFSADTVYLDEAFHLSDETIGALLPTLSARPNPQIWYTSSAPHSDSEVLHRVRARALAQDDPRLVYWEWGNEVGVEPTDRAGWLQANPALGIRISEDAVEAELRAMAPAEFARERLGVPDPPAAEAGRALPNWQALEDADSRVETQDQWALAVAPDRSFAAVGVAGRDSHGRLHVEVWRAKAGTDWILSTVQAKYKQKRLPIRIHAAGPEASFILPLQEWGVEVTEVSTGDLTRATGQLLDAAANSRLSHLGQRELDQAVSGGVLRTTPEGAAIWARKLQTAEISPLVAVTVAAGGVPVEQRKPRIH